MDVSDKLLCLFNAKVETTEDGYVVEVPRSEVEEGGIQAGEVYRIAMIDRTEPSKTEPGPSAPTEPQPPIEEGEIRYVEIEDLGKQGDGIARVERGYVIIVPNTEIGDRVKVEIQDVNPNYAAAEVVDDEIDSLN